MTVSSKQLVSVLNSMGKSPVSFAPGLSNLCRSQYHVTCYSLASVGIICLSVAPCFSTDDCSQHFMPLEVYCKQSLIVIKLIIS